MPVVPDAPDIVCRDKYSADEAMWFIQLAGHLRSASRLRSVMKICSHLLLPETDALQRENDIQTGCIRTPTQVPYIGLWYMLISN